MSHLTAAALAIFGELLLYFFMGGILPFSAKDEKKSFFETVIAGWILTAALTEGAAVLAVVLSVPLGTFCKAFSIAVAVCAAFSLAWNFRSVFLGTSVASGGIHFSLPVILVIVAIAGSAVLAVLLPASGDPGGILAQMSADQYTDSMGIAVAGTNLVRTKLTAQELLVQYYAFDSWISLLTGLHPMTVMRVTRTAVTVIVSGMVIYRIFYHLFDGELIRTSAASILAIAAGIGFRTLYTPSGILYSRGWTGNAALSNVLLPAVLLIAVLIAEPKKGPRPGLLLIVCGAASVSFSALSPAIFLAAAVAFVLPAVLVGKRYINLLGLLGAAVIPVVSLVLQAHFPGLMV